MVLNSCAGSVKKSSFVQECAYVCVCAFVGVRVCPSAVSPAPGFHLRGRMSHHDGVSCVSTGVTRHNNMNPFHTQAIFSKRMCV